MLTKYKIKFSDHNYEKESKLNTQNTILYNTQNHTKKCLNVSNNKGRTIIHTHNCDKSDTVHRICNENKYTSQEKNIRDTRCTSSTQNASMTPSRRVLVVMCVVMTFLTSFTDAMYVENELKTSEKWAFLARFCFLSMEGTFTFDVSYTMQRGSHQKILMYYDSPHQWPAVYKSGKTCEERESVMKRENNQFINLTLYSINSECEIFRGRGNTSTYKCRGQRTFRSARERWWFIAVSNCDAKNGLQLNYRLTMTNGHSFWYKHFSADEFYILRTDLIALIIQLILLFLSLLAAAELRKRHLLHTTYRLYLYAGIMQVIALLLVTAHYARYGMDGQGYPTSKLMGRIVMSMSTIMMVLVVLLMGKGFNITRGRLKQRSIVRLTTFMCSFGIVYAALFIFEQNFFDPGEVLYLYESPAGYGLVALRLIGWTMFLYSCFFTVKHYPEKADFYYPFFVLYTLWFIAGPIVILICNHLIDKWVREKVVNAVDLGVTICGHAFFVFLTRPNAANKNFPYHVRTTQITAMELSDTGRIGNNHLDRFCAHTYEPTLPPSDPKNFTTPDLFLVSGAIEMRPVTAPHGLVKRGYPTVNKGTGYSTAENGLSYPQMDRGTDYPMADNELGYPPTDPAPDYPTTDIGDGYSTTGYGAGGYDSYKFGPGKLKALPGIPKATITEDRGQSASSTGDRTTPSAPPEDGQNKQ